MFNEYEVKFLEWVGNPQFAKISINNSTWYYDAYYSTRRTHLWDRNGEAFVLPCIVLLDENNPKETIDHFFKLLMVS